MRKKFGKMRLEVTPTGDDRGWFMVVMEVARGLGVSRTNVMMHIKDHGDDIRDGIEKGVRITDTLGGKQRKTVLYRDGVIKLGFFVKSEQAVAFRQWATDLIVQVQEKGLESAALISSISQAVAEQLDPFKRDMHARFDAVEAISNQRGRMVAQLEDVVEVLEAQLHAVVPWTADEKAQIGVEMKLAAKFSKVTLHQVANLIMERCDKKDSAKHVVNFLRAMRGEGIRVVKDEEEKG